MLSPGVRADLQSISTTVYSKALFRTLWCMLKREYHQIVDLFEGFVVFRPMTDTFADDKFDATKIVGCVPVTLTEKLSLKHGEFDNIFGIYVRYDARPGYVLVCKG